jgi:hypothetical protein
MTLDDFDPTKVLVEDQRKDPDAGPNVAERVIRNIKENWRLGGVPGLFGLPYRPHPVRGLDGTTYDLDIDKLAPLRRAAPLRRTR